jgi:DNA-binding GntR family transcriptional regulator
MRQVATASDPDLRSDASALAERMRAETDPAQWTELNRAFHATLVGGVPSDRMRNLLRGLRDSAAPYVALALRHRGSDHFQTANEHHSQILAALVEGDADRCAELTRIHVDLTVRSLEEARDQFDHPDADQAS